MIFKILEWLLVPRNVEQPEEVDYRNMPSAHKAALIHGRINGKHRENSAGQNIHVRDSFHSNCPADMLPVYTQDEIDAANTDSMWLDKKDIDWEELE